MNSLDITFTRKVTRSKSVIRRKFNKSLLVKPFLITMEPEEALTKVGVAIKNILNYFKEKNKQLKDDEDPRLLANESLSGNSSLGQYVRYQLAVALLALFSHGKKNEDDHVWNFFREVCDAASEKFVLLKKISNISRNETFRSFISAVALLDRTILSEELEDRENINNVKFIAFICNALKYLLFKI